MKIHAKITIYSAHHTAYSTRLIAHTAHRKTHSAQPHNTQHTACRRAGSSCVNTLIFSNSYCPSITNTHSHTQACAHIHLHRHKQCTETITCTGIDTYTRTDMCKHIHMETCIHSDEHADTHRDRPTDMHTHRRCTQDSKKKIPIRLNSCWHSAANLETIT